MIIALILLLVTCSKQNAESDELKLPIQTGESIVSFNKFMKSDIKEWIDSLIEESVKEIRI